MFNLIISLLKFLLAGIAFLFVLFMAVFIEYSAIYFKKIFISWLKKKSEEYSFVLIKKQFLSKVVLPETASVAIVISAPVLALSALMPICTTIPYFSFIPYIQKNTDLLQIVQFLLFSEVFATLAIYALGTKVSRLIAKEMIKEFAYSCFFIIAFFTLIAVYIDKTSSITDTFKLSSLAVSGLLSTKNFLVYAVLLFISAIIFALLPHETRKNSKYLTNNNVLVEFQGAPRVIISLWSLLRSFLIISIILVTLLPFINIPSNSQNINIPWFIKTINFFVYFITIILTRSFVIPIFWEIRDKLKHILPRLLSLILIHLIIIFIICFIFLLNSNPNLILGLL
ncbi:MAG: hypothetical protein GXZ13_04325 [Synergistaceae bacterium]|nr:hypothetical protein [Synergistaceae bacterium]